MASIRRDVQLQARPETVWAAVRDIGALHTRLVPGFVLDTRLEGNTRIVTFADGRVVPEVIVDLDDATRRLVWSAKSERLMHHNASAQVFPDGERRARLVWITDVLPDEVAGDIGRLMDYGCAAMKKALDGK
jgi:carbon monoxide dehydrogenase subunit G